MNNVTSTVIINLVAVAVLIPLLHLSYGRKWQPYEMRRRALGNGALLATSGLGVLTGAYDLTTWLTISLSFVLAGVILLLMDASDKKQLTQLRSNLGGQEEIISQGNGDIREQHCEATGHHRRVSRHRF